MDVVLPAAIAPHCKLYDVTGDGRLDLLCASYSSQTTSIAVLPGMGDGTFGVPVTTLMPVLTNDPDIAATGDLNHDGHADLIVTEPTNLRTYALLGDGTGHFTVAPAIPDGGYSILATLVDLNGDGNLDLVDTGAGNDVFIFLGHGDGTFTQLAYYPYQSSVVLADVDGDGHPDLIGGQDGIFQILHGNGDGSFKTTPIVSINYGAGPDGKSGFGEYVSPYAYVDLNGDGIKDVVARADDGLTVMLGQPGLQFAARSHYPVGENFFLAPNSVADALVDMDGDGHLDFVCAGPNGIYISYGSGDGSFASAAVYKNGEDVAYAAVADFNGMDFQMSSPPGMPCCICGWARGMGRLRHRRTCQAGA